jgi:hypothetical protein
VLDGVQTDVALVALPGGAGLGRITGQVELPAGVGALVVAEAGGDGHDAAVARDGSFAILNLADGDYVVGAYAPGLVHGTAQASVVDAGEADVDLALVGDAGGAVSGSVQFVNAGGHSVTSMVMMVESTFDEALVRGAAPPHMQLPDISGDFTFTGVPPGRYVVLAAFPDDELVRDPDTCQAGTDIVHVEVAGEPVAAPTSFKITEALAMLSPEDGATVEGGVPTFSWVDDSSEDVYRIAVYDSFGILAWSTEMPGVSGENPSVTYDGDEPLPGGLYYQVRVTSARQGGTCEISTSEDLAGVFYVP